VKDNMKWNKRIMSVVGFQEAVHTLADKIPKGKYQYVFGIPRGGLIVAVYLSHRLNLELLTDRSMEMIEDPDSILVVDDLVDTGKTLKTYDIHFDTATIFYKPRSEIIPTYFIYETEDWVIFPYENPDEKPNREPFESV